MDLTDWKAKFRDDTIVEFNVDCLRRSWTCTELTGHWRWIVLVSCARLSWSHSAFEPALILLSYGTHFGVKIGFKFQSMGKIFKISSADPPPSSFRSIPTLWLWQQADLPVTVTTHGLDWSFAVAWLRQRAIQAMTKAAESAWLLVDGGTASVVVTTGSLFAQTARHWQRVLIHSCGWLA